MLQIRRYRDSDKSAVFELHNAALKPTGAFLGNGPWDQDLSDIQYIYLNNGGEFLVGEVDGRIVCMGALKRKSESLAEIKRMRVHPDFQRRGFGRMILDRLEEAAARMGYTGLCLDTTSKQTAAQKLYEKNGYREVRRGTLAGLEIIFYEKQIEL